LTEQIFVFGSNLAGRHGAGSAQAALADHGAVWGQGVGRQGRSYAIPTKDEQFRVLKPVHIKEFVREFLQYAAERPELTFNVVAIGCGFAGYHPYEIAPMFEGATSNVNLPEEFKPYLA